MGVRRFLCAAAMLLALGCAVPCLGSGLSAAQNRRATVSGYVSDAESGEVLIGAGVRVMGKGAERGGAASNAYGFYTLTIPEGKTRLLYSYVGYEDVTLDVDLKRDTVINVRLRGNSELKAAVVAASKDAGIRSSKMSAIEIPVNAVQNTPVLFGERDVLKTIQLIPGVQAGTEGFSGIYVRGGGPDENLLLLDGISMYNAEHMLGIFSIFQPEAVKKVTLYKGSFPGRYGGRCSSIIDVRTNDGNMREYHGTIGVGMVSDKLHIEGPIWRDRTAFSLSARGMHTFLFDPLMQRMDIPGNYYFYDVNGKLTHKFSDKDRVFLNVYRGRDVMYVHNDDNAGSRIKGVMGVKEDVVNKNRMDVKWGNTLAAMRWNHVFSNKLFTNFMAAYTSYDMLAGVKLENDVVKEGVTLSSERMNVSYNSGIRDVTVKADFDYTPTPRHLIKFGGEYVFHTYVPETITAYRRSGENGQNPLEKSFKSGENDKSKGHEMAVYAEDDVTIGERVNLNPGLRLVVFNTQGVNYFTAEPRLSLKVDAGRGFAVKAAYSKMSQFVHLLSSSQVTLPIDMWVPITANIKPVTSDQLSLGCYFDGLEGWEFSVEGYWKYMKNVLEYKDGVSFLANSAHWEDKVEMGNGRAYGVELFVQKTAGKTTGWIGYTLAWSDRVFPSGSINNGEPFPYKYDRRHNFSLVLNQKLGKNVDLSATWVFATGGNVTIPEKQMVVLNPDGSFKQTDYIGHRNNYRLPASHRLNVGVSFHKKHGRRMESVWDVSVYNVYNTMNPNFVFINNEVTAGGEEDVRVLSYRIKMSKITFLPIIPSVGYTFKF